MNTPLQAQPVSGQRAAKSPERSERSQGSGSPDGAADRGPHRRAASATACNDTPDQEGKRSAQRLHRGRAARAAAPAGRGDSVGGQPQGGGRGRQPPPGRQPKGRSTAGAKASATEAETKSKRARQAQRRLDAQHDTAAGQAGDAHDATHKKTSAALERIPAAPQHLSTPQQGKRIAEPARDEEIQAQEPMPTSPGSWSDRHGALTTERQASLWHPLSLWQRKKRGGETPVPSLATVNSSTTVARERTLELR
ncbi:hypothetical protein SAMN03159339_6896 [Variovorax sp. 770b2]|nr:hypothetical protein SAMN03159339_6896 [Variovorax sp. 770b2]